MSGHPLNVFVAGPDGGPVLTLRLGVTLDRLAREHAPNLQPAAVPAVGSRYDGLRFLWDGRVVDWLNFIDRCNELAQGGEDEDLGLLVRWLDEDLDEAIDAADRLAS